MDAFAPMHFGSLNDLVTIQVRRRTSQIDSIRRAQSVLGSSVWLCIYCRGLDAILRSCLVDTSRPSQPIRCYWKKGPTNKAISPRLAIL